MADTPQVMPPSRALVLNVLLSILTSAAVFVVVAWLVLVPQLARHELELRALRQEMNELRAALEAEKAPPAPAAPAPAAAPEAPAEPAKAPAAK